MALDGTELVNVTPILPTGRPAGEEVQTTTQDIANLGSSSSVNGFIASGGGSTGDWDAVPPDDGAGISLTGGHSVSGDGGVVSLLSGDSDAGDGGDINIIAANGAGANQGGGDIHITAGAGDPTDGFGGGVNITGGAGDSNGGGPVNITGGGADSAGGAGGVAISGGVDNSANGTGGSVTLSGGGASDVNGVGGSVSINAGTSNGDCGNITITLRLSGGSGDDSQLLIVNLPTADPLIAGALFSDGVPSAGTPQALKISGG